LSRNTEKVARVASVLRYRYSTGQNQSRDKNDNNKQQLDPNSGKS